MRTFTLLVCLLAVTLLGFGCNQEETVRPTPTPDPDSGKRPNLLPGAYYSLFYDIYAYADLHRINQANGRGTYVWSMDIDYLPTNDDPEGPWGPTPLGLAFDLDGSMYTTLNVAALDPADVSTQFARVDPFSGAVTPIGDPVPFNTAAVEIDACGNFYACGFDVPELGYFWGNSSLWHVDKATGEFIEVGDTGHTHWMDLAFDADGILWGTFGNKLYTIDTETGASTFVTDIYGVPDADPPRLMEVMSIAFDKHGVLYGFGVTVHYDDPRGSPVMTIDIGTGQATLLGYTYTSWYGHGGDMMPTEVRVAHLDEYGEYQCITISPDALEAHLAHGDYVPGTVGYDCDCP